MLGGNLVDHADAAKHVRRVRAGAARGKPYVAPVEGGGNGFEPLPLLLRREPLHRVVCCRPDHSVRPAIGDEPGLLRERLAIERSVLRIPRTEQRKHAANLYSGEKRASGVGVGGMDDVDVLEIAVFVLPLVARHRDERTVFAVDELDSVNSYRIVEREVGDCFHVACGKGLGDLCVDFHGLPPSCDDMKKEPDCFSDSSFR